MAFRIIKAVLFDFDGTLTKPGTLDFQLIKEEMNCPENLSILEYLSELSGEKKAAAEVILEAHEQRGALASLPNDGAEDAVLELRRAGIKTGIISRNSTASIETAFRAFQKIGKKDFDVLITRDSPVDFKPSPDGVYKAARDLGIRPEEILVAGDYIFDIQAGSRAGALTVFLSNNEETAFDYESDYTISQLSELPPLVGIYQPLTAGKIPNELLGRLLGTIEIHDASVIIGPGIGEDVAVVSADGIDCLALKSDPITFATDRIGYYALAVNANDIATSGAVPRWFLTTLLLPPGITLKAVEDIIRDISSVCGSMNITLCGGHTEITDAVNRPVVCGMMIGELKKNALIDKKQMEPGDLVYLTKTIGLEGTTIIAREFSELLTDRGMSRQELDKCCGLISSLSIVREAAIAAEGGFASAMHDITEGGFATAVRELAISGGCLFRIDLDRLPVLEETRKICRISGLDYNGLIGSGSLLLTVKKGREKAFEERTAAEGIRCTCIGEVKARLTEAAGDSVEAWMNGKKVQLPVFRTDEITKLF